MNASVEEFYRTGYATQPIMSCSERDRSVRTRDVLLSQQPFIGGEQEIAAKIVETYAAVRNEVSDNQDYTFEIATINPGATQGDVLIASTYSSSLTGNAGNVFELAVKAALDPDHRYTYVALPGNGGSSVLSAKERRHFARTGSLLDYTEKNPTALPVVKALARVIMRNGVEPLHLSSDSAGALLTTALGTQTPRNSVKTVFQNVRTGFSDLSPYALAKHMLVKDRKCVSVALKASPDNLKVNHNALNFTGQLRPDGLSQPATGILKRLSMLGAYADGLSIGLNNGHDPLVDDMSMLLRNNPDARARFVCEGNDILVSTERLSERISHVLGRLSVATSQPVDLALVHDGFHSAHTAYPQYIDAIRRNLIDRV